MSKKLVHVKPETPNRSAGQSGGAQWKATPEAKRQAGTLRIIAVLLWLLAIAGEAFAIFKLLKESSVDMTLLIVAIVVIGVLAVIGDLLWKKANRLDPASRSDPVRFFIQNQLGVIIGLIAFLPLIILIFTNKNMDKKQKGLAGGIAIAVLVIAALFGISFNPPSTEGYAQQTALPQYPEEVAVVVGYTGQDLVFWTKEGTVYHLCQAVSPLQLVSQDNTIYSGTVAEAHAAGMDRLTYEVQMELNQCGLSSTP